MNRKDKLKLARYIAKVNIAVADTTCMLEDIYNIHNNYSEDEIKEVLELSKTILAKKGEGFFEVGLHLAYYDYFQELISKSEGKD